MNKIYSALLLVPFAGAASVWAQAPASVANKTIRLDMSKSQVSRSDIHQAPVLPWYQLENITDFVIDFPASEDFAATVNYGGGLTSEVRVSYSAATEPNRGLIQLGCKDFSVQVALTYANATGGAATIAWHEAGDTRHFRQVSFTVQDDSDEASRVELPEEIVCTADPEYVWDDGLQDILRELEQTRYRTATEKLYQKRLVSMLPTIMMLHDASWTSPDYKGNTALHYACSLGHIELVRWLVAHGADLESRTDKGAHINACIGGKNSASIKKILQEARAWRDAPYKGPSIDEEAAQKAATWLAQEFAGEEMNNPEYDITLDEQKARQMAQLVYRYTKQNRSIGGLGLERTEMLAGYLMRVLNAKVSEEMFVAWIEQDLKQSRMHMQVEQRGDGLSLATLPHMIKVREEEGMPYDGSTAIYRAASEGNVELVRWLLEHGADTRLLDKQGNVVKELKNIPNEELIRNLLNQHIAPANVAGKTFTFRPKQGGAAISATWQGMNEETQGTVKENEDWRIIKTRYMRTGPDSATVTRHAEWAPGGHYADGWATYTFQLKFTSATQGTATCTTEAKNATPTTCSGAFSLQ